MLESQFTTFGNFSICGYSQRSLHNLLTLLPNFCSFSLFLHFSLSLDGCPQSQNIYRRRIAKNSSNNLYLLLLFNKPVNLEQFQPKSPKIRQFITFTQLNCELHGRWNPARLRTGRRTSGTLPSLSSWITESGRSRTRACRRRTLLPTLAVDWMSRADPSSSSRRW